MVFLGTVCTSQAMTWADLWQRPDQQAATLLKDHQAKQAAAKFQNKQWQATANYRAKDYPAAAKEFGAENTATGYYNQGNALALAGKTDAAITAYQKSLTLQPKSSDAKYNLKVLQQHKKQQQKQSSNSKQSKQKNQHKKQQSKSSSSPQKKSNGKAKQNPQNKPSQQQASQKKNGKNTKQQQQQQQQQQQPVGQAKKLAQQTRPMTAAEKKAHWQQQQTKHWLAKIPDNPGGLLKQKFLRDYQRRQQEK